MKLPGRARYQTVNAAGARGGLAEGKMDLDGGNVREAHRAREICEAVVGGDFLKGEGLFDSPAESAAETEGAGEGDEQCEHEGGARGDED